MAKSRYILNTKTENASGVSYSTEFDTENVGTNKSQNVIEG